jgi:hypothetical protein
MIQKRAALMIKAALFVSFLQAYAFKRHLLLG